MITIPPIGPPLRRPPAKCERDNVTVGIAAICNIGAIGGPMIVAAADRMITIRDIEYEPAQTKTFYLATQTIVIFAGDMETHASICPITLAKTSKLAPVNITVKNIAEIYANEFAEYRRQEAEIAVLKPLGLDLQSFLLKQKDMPADIVNELTRLMHQYVIHSEAIIVRIDHPGAHIY